MSFANVLPNKAVEDDGKLLQIKNPGEAQLSDGLNNSSFDIYDVGEHLDAMLSTKLNSPNTVVIDLVKPLLSMRWAI